MYEEKFLFAFSHFTSSIKTFAECLLTRKYVDQNSVKYLIAFLRASLVDDSKSWKRAGADLKVILENTVAFYNHNAVSERSKLEIFRILSSVVDVPFLKKYSHFKLLLGRGRKIFFSRSSQHYHAWLSSLPRLLCESKITDVSVEALLALARKNVQVFYKALQEKLSAILGRCCFTS